MSDIKRNRSVLATIATVFVLGYGLHYLGYFLRVRYFNWLDTLQLDEGLAHSLGYLGHVIFLIIMVIYALMVKQDRKYVFSFCRGPALRNLKYAVIGAVTGFAMMGICIGAAAMNGDLVIGFAPNANYGLFAIAALCVFVQASVEEIEGRGFVFGKMNAEGVPTLVAVLVSSFYFSYLHSTNPGFGLLPLISLLIIGIFYALSYYYFGTLWFAMTAHMMWNFTQDFIFGLPDSGKPAVDSILSTTVNSSSFFYDKTFGIEGSKMALIVNGLACLVVFLIGVILMSDTPDTQPIKTSDPEAAAIKTVTPHIDAVKVDTPATDPPEPAAPEEEN
ncbi:MAG: CPBP family intramembrane metalloprotease [Eubacterium sp.]|nr:CPBP family intramembrane metalloprotease [Eubacterium sp.]